MVVCLYLTQTMGSICLSHGVGARGGMGVDEILVFAHCVCYKRLINVLPVWPRVAPVRLCRTSSADRTASIPSRKWLCWSPEGSRQIHEKMWEQSVSPLEGAGTFWDADFTLKARICFGNHWWFIASQFLTLNPKAVTYKGRENPIKPIVGVGGVTMEMTGKQVRRLGFSFCLYQQTQSLGLVSSSTE